MNFKCGQSKCAAGQGRVVKRVEIPPWKVGQTPGRESLEALYGLSVG